MGSNLIKDTEIVQEWMIQVIDEKENYKYKIDPYTAGSRLYELIRNYWFLTQVLGVQFIEIDTKYFDTA